MKLIMWCNDVLQAYVRQFMRGCPELWFFLIDLKDDDFGDELSLGACEGLEKWVPSLKKRDP